jgi:hypothetical protein
MLGNDPCIPGETRGQGGGVAKTCEGPRGLQRIVASRYLLTFQVAEAGAGPRGLPPPAQGLEEVTPEMCRQKFHGSGNDPRQPRAREVVVAEAMSAAYIVCTP